MSRYVEQQGQRYKVMTLRDFRIFRDLALSDDAAWTTHYSDAVLTVQSKAPDDGASALNIIRARRVMARVTPEVLYNQLHDAQYRVTWDKNMLEGYNIVQLDAHNDMGYYAAKFPWPLANRDFCNMRSWMEFTNGEYIIMNHSEPHPSCPEKKGFVRARSILTGFYMRPHRAGTGTELIYVTHSDPCGSIPHTIINFAMTKGARMILNNCEKCSEEYPDYVAKTYPRDYAFPWRTAKVDWDGDDDEAAAADSVATTATTTPVVASHAVATTASPAAATTTTASTTSATTTTTAPPPASSSSPPPPVAPAAQPAAVVGHSDVAAAATTPMRTRARAGDGGDGESTTRALAAPPPPPQPLPSLSLPLSPSSHVASPAATRTQRNKATTAATTTTTTQSPVVAKTSPRSMKPCSSSSSSDKDAADVARFRATMQEAIESVDRSFAHEQRVPSTSEYLLRLWYTLEGIRCTCAP